VLKELALSRSKSHLRDMALANLHCINALNNNNNAHWVIVQYRVPNSETW